MFKILFVNPDEKFVQIYTRPLHQHFLLDSAHDGLSALRKFKINPPSLVVSEYHLPHLSGLGLLRFLRTQTKPNATPFIFLTDYHDRSEALGLGASDWIPLNSSSPDLLIEKIYHHLTLNKWLINQLN
jgi:DNA-binding response OmpR family regulator